MFALGAVWFSLDPFKVRFAPHHANVTSLQNTNHVQKIPVRMHPMCLKSKIWIQNNCSYQTRFDFFRFLNGLEGADLHGAGNFPEYHDFHPSIEYIMAVVMSGYMTQLKDQSPLGMWKTSKTCPHRYKHFLKFSLISLDTFSSYCHKRRPAIQTTIAGCHIQIVLIRKMRTVLF